MNRFLTAAVTIAALTFGMSANAASFKGTFWDGNPANLNTIDQAIAFANANTPDATFTSTAINYGTPGDNWLIGTLGSFLAADASSLVGAAPTTSFLGSVLKLTGSSFLTTGDEITVTSDDGFRLFVGNTVLSEFLGIRAPNSTTAAIFGGPTGTYNVTLWYFEGQQTQAQLLSNLAPVPLPAGGLLLLTALVGGGLAARRRRA